MYTSRYVHDGEMASNIGMLKQQIEPDVQQSAHAIDGCCYNYGKGYSFNLLRVVIYPRAYSRKFQLTLK